jgi:fructose-1,6-bisphosphatase/inositol monophosphatase family enzyme
MSEEKDDFENEDDLPLYDVDDETRDIIQVACGLISNLAAVQLDEQARENLLTIADSLAERFAIDSIELEEQIHIGEDGEEIIYKPKGGIFNEEEEKDGDS